MHCNKVCKGFVVAFSNAGQQFLGGSFFTAGDIHDIFGIDDHAVGDGVHTYGFWVKDALHR